MALRTLRYEEDEILRKKSRPVQEITPKLLELLDDMVETMRDKNGVGLAAPQIGVLKRVVVIDVGEGLHELINPEIVSTEGTQEEREGCLSLPGKSGFVERPMKTVVKALNRHGEEITVEGEAFMSIALNHELDHLDGILYIDKVIDMDEEDGEYDDDDYEDEE